jgi:leader peptidase (prepilin peptidase)/N-methyltransferase
LSEGRRSIIARAERHRGEWVRVTPLVLSAAFWNANPLFFATVIAILALIAGSFLNVVILRLPVMMDREWRRNCTQLMEPSQTTPDDAQASLSLAFPPSTCPRCGHRIRPWENVPVLSWLVLRGRCTSCRKPISIRYPLIEAATAIISVAVALRFGVDWKLPAALTLTWAMIALTVIDIDHQLLPDDITLPLLWAGLIVNSQALFVPLHEAVWGAVAGYLSLWSVYWAFKLVTGKEGMGYGDFKLLAALGAWMGWKALPMIIVLSSLVGAVVGMTLILTLGRDRNLPIPFGPYIAIAGWIALVFGDELQSRYWAMAHP